MKFGSVAKVSAAGMAKVSAAGMAKVSVALIFTAESSEFNSLVFGSGKLSLFH